MSLFDALARFFGGKPNRPDSVAALSDNPVALAEVLLLFRVVLADGMVHQSQLTEFARICDRQYGIGVEDIEDLHSLLDSLSGQTRDADAIALLTQLDSAQRSALLEDMVRIARANAELDVGENKLIRMTARLLGLEAEVAQMVEKD